MALLKLGGGISELRGSIGGTVFARNRSGAYARNRTKPVDPCSSRQVSVRAIMTMMYGMWALLTAAQRTAWSTFANNVTVSNRLGESITLSGFNMFTKTVAAMKTAGLAPVTTAPTVFALPSQSTAIVPTPDASSKNYSIAFDNTESWATEIGGALLISEGLPQNPTVNFYKGPFQYLGKIAGATTAPTSPAVIASNNTMATGQRVWLSCRVLRADGRLSNPFRIVGTVQV